MILIALRFERRRSGAEELISAGGDLEARDSLGQTPLLRAVIASHRELVELLLKHGADPNARDNSGETTIHHVVLWQIENERNGITDLLLAPWRRHQCCRREWESCH